MTLCNTAGRMVRASSTGHKVSEPSRNSRPKIWNKHTVKLIDFCYLYYRHPSFKSIKLKSYTVCDPVHPVNVKMSFYKMYLIKRVIILHLCHEDSNNYTELVQSAERSSEGRRSNLAHIHGCQSSAETTEYTNDQPAKYDHLIRSTQSWKSHQTPTE